jgi:hypothetical protein
MSSTNIMYEGEGYCEFDKFLMLAIVNKTLNYQKLYKVHSS